MHVAPPDEIANAGTGASGPASTPPTATASSSQPIDPGQLRQRLAVSPATGDLQATRNALQSRTPISAPAGDIRSRRWIRLSWPQATFHLPFMRGERDAVQPDYELPNHIPPIGRREPLPPPPLNLSLTGRALNTIAGRGTLLQVITGRGIREPLALMTVSGAVPTELKQVASTIAGQRPLDERQLLTLKCAVAVAFPALAASPQGPAGLELVAVASAVIGVTTPRGVSEMAQGMACLDGALLLRSLPQALAMAPGAQRCIELLMTLARAGGPGAGIAAAMAAERNPSSAPDAAGLAQAAISDIDDSLAALRAGTEETPGKATPAQLKRDVIRTFPRLASSRWGNAATDLVAIAQADAGVAPGAGLHAFARSVRKLDARAWRGGLPAAADERQAIAVLMSLARSGDARAGIGACLLHEKGAPASDATLLRALAREPVDIEHRPDGFAALQAALCTHVSKLPVERQLTEAEAQVATFALQQVCQHDAAQAARAASQIASPDLRGEFAGLDGGAPHADVLIAHTALRHLALSGGVGVQAACKLADLEIADLRVACLAARALDPECMRSFGQVAREAAALHEEIANARPTEAERGAKPPPSDIEAQAAQVTPDALDAQWPSPAQLRQRGVPEAHVDKRLPAFALVAVSRRLAGTPPTEAQAVAFGAVRNRILGERGGLAFAEAQCRKLGVALRPSSWIDRKVLGGRWKQDAVQPVVDNGPLGALRNIAVPQQGMKESFPPLGDLLAWLVSSPHAGEPDPTDEQRYTDFGRLALLHHWRDDKTQAMLGTVVELQPEQLEQIGNRATALAGVTEPGEVAAFSKAVQAQLKDARLDQGQLFEVYTDVAKRTLERALATTEAEWPGVMAMLARLDDADDAILRAVQSVAAYDTRYRDDPSLPAVGRGAMDTRPANAGRRDQNRALALAEIVRQLGTSSGANMTSYRGFSTPDILAIATLVLRVLRISGFGGRVGANLSGPYQYSRIWERILRVGVNATGVELNFGEGTTRSSTWSFGGGPGIGLARMLGQWLRLNLVVDFGIGNAESGYRSVFLRVPRTSQQQGGVPGAGSGSSFDALRTRYLADIIEDMQHLLVQGKSNVLLRLLARHPAMSLGIAGSDRDFTDTTFNERLGRFSASQGLASVWRFPFSVGGSLAASYIPRRELRIHTGGNVDATRRQDFTQRKAQVGASALLAGRVSPFAMGASMLPHRLNFPSSWTFLETEIDGVIDRGGTYWSYETESRAEMIVHFREHGLRYARGMLASRPDLARIREKKLQGVPPAEVDRQRQALLDADVQAQLELLHAMILDREYLPGRSYRGTGEVSEQAHADANAMRAVRELAALSGETMAWSRRKERQRRHMLSQPSASFIHNDVGFRTNTYKKDDSGLAGYVFGGKKMDARTNTYRAKVL